MHKSLPNVFIFADKFSNQIFKNNNTNIGVIYRNYQNTNKEKELIKIAKECKRKRYKLFVSNSVKLALKVKANGVYIPAFNKTKRFINYGKKDFIILGSAHNQKEINQKILQKCNAIFLSPIFYVKKRLSYLDVYKFNSLARSNKTSFFALGGISKDDLKTCMANNGYGVSGISKF